MLNGNILILTTCIFLLNKASAIIINIYVVAFIRINSLGFLP